jgi:phosphoribosyl 1,2-cyclic phosphate phosphodiesterase
LEITILGSGTSTGVPVVGCSCPVCSSDDPRDRRSRASVWLRSGELSILFDTSTEFRLQALAAGIRCIDAVFLTHAHADHVHGLDDLRPMTHHRPIPVYGSAATLSEIEERFSYIFRNSQLGGGKPRLVLQRLEGPVTISPAGDDRLDMDRHGHGDGRSGTDGGRPGADRPGEERRGADRPGALEVVPIPLFHGELPILGFRVGSFAYLTDCSEIPDSSYALLDGVELLVIDALRFRPHPTHFNVEEALAAVRRIGADTAYFTHLCHEVSYREMEAALPDGVHPAYDGLTCRTDS